MRQMAANYDPNKNSSAPEAPPPVTFPEAEKMLAPATKAWANNAKVTVKREWLTAGTWEIVRDPPTARVVGRQASTRLYYQGANGPKELPTNCYRKDFCVLWQDNLGGSSWSPAVLKCEGAELEKHHVECSAVDALPGAAP
jgi:hypothetical protein